jgi:hypothetical protein
MKKLLTALVIIVSLGIAGSVCPADFAKGVNAHRAGDFATALREFTALAEQGYAVAALSNLTSDKSFKLGSKGYVVRRAKGKGASGLATQKVV